MRQSSTPPPHHPGTVFSVESGDTLTLAGPPRPNGPPLKKTITLASLIAPKLVSDVWVVCVYVWIGAREREGQRVIDLSPPSQGRRDGSTPDEPFAHASREFLRTLAIGQPATFRVDYTLDAAPGRVFGSVFVGPASTNAALAVAAAGWARVRRSPTGPASLYLDDLVAATEAAEAAGVGVFGGDGAAADAAGPPPAGGAGGPLLSSAGGVGATIPGVVDYVASGSFLRVTLTGVARGVPILVAGVASPPVRAPVAAADSAAPTHPSDPFAPVAKHFTEARTLCRDVTVTLRGVDKHGNLLASVAFGGGEGEGENNNKTDLATALASAGLAKAVEWGLAVLPPSTANALRDVDRKARAARVGVWRGYVPPAGGATTAAGAVRGTVVEAVSGDCVSVAPDGGGPEVRLCLASVRAPRPSRRGEAGEPGGEEAKEFLRSRCVGKRVVATLAYERAIGGAGVPAGAAAATTKPAATLAFAALAVDRGSAKDPLDAALPLLAAGLATVAKHRADDARAPAYDAYVEAEAGARAAKRGVHSATPLAPPRPVNDVSAPGAAARARQYLPFMQRGTVAGIVEHVVSGHRLKVRVPGQGVTIAFSPSGVRAPSTKPKTGPGAPAAPSPPSPEDLIAAEATVFVRRACLQRECELRVTSCDRGGTMIGVLTIPSSGFDLGPALLSAGLARLSGPEDTIPASLAAAQAAARAAGKGVWSLPQPEPRADDTPSASTPPLPPILDVVVTDVRGVDDISVQTAGDPRVAWLRDALAAAALDRAPPSSAPPRVGALIAARFPDDNAWYRARVEGKPGTGGGALPVTYIDWGNGGTVPLHAVRALPPALADASAAPPQATTVALAYVKPTGDADARAGAADAVAAALGGGGRLRAAVGAASGGGGGGGAWGGARAAPAPRRVALLLADPDAEPPAGADAPPAPEDTLQAALLRAGVLRVAPPACGGGDESVLAALAAAEADARRRHVGVWEYGDPGSDDE